MASLNFSNVVKIYSNGFQAVNDFNLDVKDKEFIIFVGPSGCGKSTTMRMVAGLEDISKGTISIGDRVVNDLPPKERNIAMVFQDYALYPHMTVAQNLSLSLRIKRVQKDIIKEKVKAAAEILGITELLDRYPRQLSGGQRQRVALGRAIVRTPDVFLFDEPLSNLDPKLRTTMRVEIKKLHQKLNATMIYVTHDQSEAMTLGDRIVVMNLGVIQQIDDPITIYDQPNNKFVAGFIGTPPMNFFQCTLFEKQNKLYVQNTYFTLAIPDKNGLHKKLQQGFKSAPRVTLGIRAEDMRISFNPDPKQKNNHNYIHAAVDILEPMGSEVFIHMKMDTTIKHRPKSEQTPSLAIAGQTGNNNFVVRSENTVGYKVKPDDAVTVEVDLEKIHLFDSITEQIIR